MQWKKLDILLGVKKNGVSNSWEATIRKIVEAWKAY